MFKKNKKEEKKIVNDQIDDEEIEIIDIYGEMKEQTSKRVVKKRKLKKGLFFQVLFCTLSIFFIIGCCVFYGLRLIKYYKIFNPKDENGKAVSLIANHITSGATFVYEGEGIYLINGSYIYKGENVNNYIKYSGLLWRIIKINEDKSLDIVLDTTINSLKWNSKIDTFSNSDINKYLNEEFLTYLNKDLLSKTSVCTNVIDDVTKIRCDEFDTSDYVRLINIDEFLNSKVDNKTYISDGTNIWLSTRGTTNVWTINGESLSYADVNETYNIKPVVTLKNTNQVLGGKGTPEDPYRIEKEKDSITIGSYVKLDKDIWTVYKVDKENLYLSLSSLYEDGNKTFRYDTESNKYNTESKYSLAEYLNNEYLESLSYKDKLIETDWFIGEYKDSYKDILEEKITSKVGLSNVIDLKFDKVYNYYILNGNESKIYYVVDNGLVLSKPGMSRAIKPSICIKIAKITEGNGTKDSPYILEG